MNGGQRTEPSEEQFAERSNPHCVARWSGYQAPQRQAPDAAGKQPDASATADGKGPLIMMITFPKDNYGDAETAERDRYDVAEKEAASRVRSGYCPLCARPTNGLAVTCGDIQCLQFMREQPQTVRWLLDELHRCYLDNQAYEAATDNAVMVVPVDIRFALMLVTAGMAGALAVLFALAVGVWLG
jgi:hypothetical protein